MSVFMWLLAAAAAGWLACAVLDLKAASTLIVSVVLGGVGVVFGGDALAPAIRREGGASVLSPFAVLVVCAVAIGFLNVGRVMRRDSLGGLAKRDSENTSPTLMR
jgi:hypothetical protein